MGTPNRHVERAYRRLSMLTSGYIAKCGMVHRHNPHVTSVAPMTGSTAVLPSSHSTQVRKFDPLVVEVNSPSRQTMASATMPTVEASHTG